jgi:hypothetical protein
LSTTGQPAAKADAVSPPATENASGKLLAPNTATGPIPIRRMRRSGRGGVRAGNAVSMRASRHEPSRSSSANRRSWPTVRPRSPSSRARGRPDFGHRAFDQFVADRQYLLGDRVEKDRALAVRRRAKGVE